MKSRGKEADLIELSDLFNPEEMKSKKKEKKESISKKEIFLFLIDYFIHSDEKLIAWLLLFGIIISVIAFVALLAVLSWWSIGFWAAITAYAWVPFLISVGQFFLIAAGLVVTHVLTNYHIGVLSNLWRNWLTERVLHKMFHGKTNYLELKRLYPEIDNIGQRIQEGIKFIVDATLNLGTDLLRSLLSLGTFIGTLWVVGGTLSIVLAGFSIVIPGYLVWAALLTALVITAATHYAGKSLAKKTQKLESLEANFRQEITVLTTNAESIELEDSASFYKDNIKKELQDISVVTQKKLNIQSRVSAIQMLNAFLPHVLPYLLAAPLFFFGGPLSLIQFQQVGMASHQVSQALSWIVNNYELFSKYTSDMQRILGLVDALKKELEETQSDAISRKEKNTDCIKIKKLCLKEARTNNLMIQNVNFQLNPKKNTLIKGPSGLGKSTLFKAIADKWRYGSGKISVPANTYMYFLPQEPVLREGTFKSLLSYPHPETTYTLKKYQKVLKLIGGMDKFLDNLKDPEVKEWKLSGGERQRIAFARALLKKPVWLFLDEATSNLDEESEAHIYTILSQLENTTVVSIAHRSTVDKYHQRIIFFNADKERHALIYEEEPNDSDKPNLLL